MYNIYIYILIYTHVYKYINVLCLLAELSYNQQYVKHFCLVPTLKKSRSTEIQQQKLSTLSKVLTTEWSLVSCRCQWCQWCLMLLKQKCWWKHPWMCRGADMFHDVLHWIWMFMGKSEMTSTFLRRWQVSLESVKLLAIAGMQGSIILTVCILSFLWISQFPHISHPFFRRQFKQIKDIWVFTCFQDAFWVAEQNLRQFNSLTRDV